MKPKVFVSRMIPDLERLQGLCEVDVWLDELPPPYAALCERVRGVDGLLCMLTDRIDAGLMDAAGANLKIISQMAVGYDNVDVLAARERGIHIGNTPGVLTETTADLAFALLLASARRLLEGVRYIQAGKWGTWHPTALLGHDVTGATPSSTTRPAARRWGWSALGASAKPSPNAPPGLTCTSSPTARA